MDTQKNQKQDKMQDQKRQPQKQWDERPGERTSNPEEQQVQRVWEEARKKQQKHASRPGIDKSDLTQLDADGNPTNRGEDIADRQ